MISGRHKLFLRVIEPQATQIPDKFGGRLLGVRTIPNWPFDVNGDINIADPGNLGGYTYRINGIPISSGGGGGGGQAQTPWLSNIDAGGFNLNNATQINCITLAATGNVGCSGVYATGGGNFGGTVNCAGLIVNGVPITGGGAAQSPWTGNINGAGFTLSNVGRIGIGTANPAYPIDVVGNINVSGAFLVNGVPISAGGGSQTPWTSDINANGHNLSGVNQISVSGASAFGGLATFSNGMSVTGPAAFSSLTVGGVAIVPVFQTPWTSNIDGGAHNLSNVNGIACSSLTVNGVPITGGGQPQSPWLTDINAAGHSLSGAANIVASGAIDCGNLSATNDISGPTLEISGFAAVGSLTTNGTIGVGAPAQANYAYYCVSGTGAIEEGFSQVQNYAQGWAGLFLKNNVGQQVSWRLYCSAAGATAGTWQIDANVSGSIFVPGNGGVGINVINPTRMLDVAGDTNIGGVLYAQNHVDAKNGYYMNGLVAINASGEFVSGAGIDMRAVCACSGYAVYDTSSVRHAGYNGYVAAWGSGGQLLVINGLVVGS